MKQASDWGEFCNVVGITPRNRILECFLEGKEMDFGRGSIVEMTGLKRATVYRIMDQLIEQEFIIPTRRVGGSQLYKLDKGRKEVRLLISIFDLILKRIEQEVTVKQQRSSKKQNPEEWIKVQ